MKYLFIMSMIFWGNPLYADVVHSHSDAEKITRMGPAIGPEDSLPDIQEMNTSPNPVPDIDDDKNFDQTLKTGNQSSQRSPASDPKGEKKSKSQTPPIMRTNELGPNKW